jgi:hypothetical protein
MKRSDSWIVSGLVLALVLASSPPPALGATANGNAPAGSCGVMAFDASTSVQPISQVGGNTQLGTVNAGLPCDGPVLVSLTTELATAGASLMYTTMVATCIAPAVPGGCTVPGTPTSPVPDGSTLLSSSGPFNIETRTTTAVFPNLTRGNYRFDVFIANGIPGVSVNAERRIWTIHAGGTLPQTAPGSSQ